MERMQGSGRGRVRGITLVEQMMALAILAVLVGVASPSLAGLVRRSRVQSAQMDFLNALAFARDEAVIERMRVVFEPARHQSPNTLDLMIGNRRRPLLG